MVRPEFAKFVSAARSMSVLLFLLEEGEHLPPEIGGSIAWVLAVVERGLVLRGISNEAAAAAMRGASEQLVILSQGGWVWRRDAAHVIDQGLTAAVKAIPTIGAPALASAKEQVCG